MGLFDTLGGALGGIFGPVGGAIGTAAGKLGDVLTTTDAQGNRQLSPLGNLGLNLGTGVGTSLLGGALGKQSSTPLESQVLNSNLAAQNIGLNTGQNLLGVGSQALQQPINYWSSILSGNRGAMTSALGPELSRIGQGYQTATNTSAALNPRGGPSAQFNADLPYQQQRDVTQLFQGARPQAATSLAGAGASALNTGANALYASTAAGRSILEQQEALRQLQAKQGSSIGSGLFSQLQQSGVLGQLGKTLGGLFGGGGSGGSVSGPADAGIYGRQ